jgi:hypothetical protein
MNRSNWAIGCAVIVLSSGLLPAIVRGEAADSPSKIAMSGPAIAAATPSPSCNCVGEEGSSTVARVRAALASPLKDTGIEYNDQPLEQVVKQLQDEYRIPIQLDLPALQDAGLNPQEPVTVNVHDVLLRSALRLMLKQHQLTYTIQNEVVLITTPEEAETHLLTCVYDVRDLLSGAGDAEGMQSLVQAITSCVATESWAANGGDQPQVQSVRPGILVISQTEQAQEDIRSLLDALRRAQ